MSIPITQPENLFFAELELVVRVLMCATSASRWTWLKAAAPGGRIGGLCFLLTPARSPEFRGPEAHSPGETAHGSRWSRCRSRGASRVAQTITSPQSLSQSPPRVTLCQARARPLRVMITGECVVLVAEPVGHPLTHIPPTSAQPYRAVTRRAVRPRRRRPSPFFSVQRVASVNSPTHSPRDNSTRPSRAPPSPTPPPWAAVTPPSDSRPRRRAASPAPLGWSSSPSGGVYAHRVPLPRCR